MWQIDRNKLTEGLDLLSLVPEKLGIPCSTYVKVKGEGSKIRMSLASYISSEVILEGKGKWPTDKSIFIDRRTFFPWVSVSKEIKNKNLFEFSSHKGQLIVRHGKRNVALDSTTKYEGYGKVEKVLAKKGSSIPISPALRDVLLCGQNCATSDSAVPHLNCVYVTNGASSGLGIRAYAVNNKVFYYGAGNIEKGKIRAAVPFPLFLINLLQVPGLQKITWVGESIVFTFKNGWVWQQVSKEAVDNFPVVNLRKYYKRSKKFPVAFVLSSKRFSDLMVRVSHYLQSVRRMDWVVNVEGKRKSDSVHVSTSIPGAKFKERIYSKEPLKRDLKMEWPLDILSPVFEFLASKTKKVAITARVDEKHGIGYLTAGSFWLSVPSRQKEEK